MASEITDDESWMELHETLGNDPGQWLLQADSLLRAGEILYANIGPPPTEESARDMSANEDALEEAVWDWFSVHNVGRMLRGMGLECLLKAAWLRAGQVLFENGRFVKIPGTSHHDLYSMYNEVNRCRRIVLDTEEKELLARLSYAIVSARYPVPTSPRKYPNAPSPPTKMHWNRCEHEEDTRVFRSLLTKFLEAAMDSA